MADIVRVSSTEFGKDVRRYQDMALSQPVVVTRNGCDLTVMISAEEYQRLKQGTVMFSPPESCPRR